MTKEKKELKYLLKGKRYISGNNKVFELLDICFYRNESLFLYIDKKEKYTREGKIRKNKYKIWIHNSVCMNWERLDE